VLPHVLEQDEKDVRAAFAAVMPVRALGDQAQAVGGGSIVLRDRRTNSSRRGGCPVHRIEPAGTPVGPVILIAEEAVATGSSERLTIYLTRVLQDELSKRLSEISALAATKNKSVADARRYVEAMLGFEVYSHTLLKALTAYDGHHGNG
jgi:hypothetical protein